MQRILHSTGFIFIWPYNTSVMYAVIRSKHWKLKRWVWFMIAYVSSVFLELEKSCQKISKEFPHCTLALIRILDMTIETMALFLCSVRKCPFITIYFWTVNSIAASMRPAAAVFSAINLQACAVNSTAYRAQKLRIIDIEFVIQIYGQLKNILCNGYDQTHSECLNAKFKIKALWMASNEIEISEPICKSLQIYVICVSIPIDRQSLFRCNVIFCVCKAIDTKRTNHPLTTAISFYVDDNKYMNKLRYIESVKSIFTDHNFSQSVTKCTYGMRIKNAAERFWTRRDCGFLFWMGLVEALAFYKVNMRQAYGGMSISNGSRKIDSILCCFSLLFFWCLSFAHSPLKEAEQCTGKGSYPFVTFSLPIANWARCEWKSSLHTNWAIHHTHNFVVTVHFIFFSLFSHFIS